jgi:hypothetical protein
MRQPTTATLQATVDPTPALRSVIAAIPDDRLREFVLEVLLAGLTAAPASVRAKAPATLTPQAGTRPRGWPRGRPRGPRKPADKAARLVAQRRRDAEKKRAARAAARAARQAKPNGSKGRGSPEITPAQTMWQHAEKLQPKAPWRVIVREFGINEAVAQDAHRTHKLPPGITGDAVSRFLELPPS